MDASKISNTGEMHRYLLEQMGKVASGEVSTDTSKAMCNLAQQVYNTVAVEVRMMSAVAKLGEDAKVKPIEFD